MLRITTLVIAVLPLLSCGKSEESSGAKSAGPEATEAASPAGQETPMTPGQKERAAKLAAKGWCKDWVTDALVTEHCGEHAPLEVSGSIAEGGCLLHVLDTAGVNIDLSIAVSKSSPETWPTDVLGAPAKVELTAFSKGGGEGRFSAYPYMFSVNSGGPTATCDVESLTSLAQALIAAAPDKEAAPAAGKAIPGCDELLSSADIKSTCGADIALKASGMADGKWNVCNSAGKGLIFILSRHAQASQALAGARISAEASVEDGTVHVATKANRTAAVAPVGTLLLELKSIAAGGQPGPCNEGQLQTLAELVVSRLR